MRGIFGVGLRFRTRCPRARFDGDSMRANVHASAMPSSTLAPLLVATLLFAFSHTLPGCGSGDDADTASTVPVGSAGSAGSIAGTGGASGQGSAGAAGKTSGGTSGASASGGSGGSGAGAAGASGGGAGGAAGQCDIAPDVDAHLVAYVHALCGQYEGCCKTASLGYDATPCETQYLGFARQFAQDAGCVAKLDVQKAKACLDSFALADATFCGAPDYETDTTHLACSDAVFGTVAPGDPCKSKLDCAPVPGASVSCTDSGFGPTCRDTVLGAVGASCKSPTNGQTHVLGCGPDMYCDDLGTKKCRKVGAVGDPCAASYSGSCRTGLKCASGACVEGTVPLGASCATDLCAPDSHCDATSHTCVKSAKLGGPCLADGTCLPIGGKEACVAGKCGIAKGVGGELVCAP